MIILTVNPDSKAERHQFDQAIIMIGAGVSAHSDLILTGESLKENHVKLFEEDGEWFAVNLANDPFVSLNGLPFGKKKIKNHDILQIGTTNITFENAKEILVDTEEKIPEILDRALAAKAIVPSKLKTYAEIPEPAPVEELVGQHEQVEHSDTIRFEDLLKQVDQLDQKSHSLTFKDKNSLKPEENPQANLPEFDVSVVPGSSSFAQARQTFRPSLRDDYLRHLDDEHQQWSESDKHEKSQPPHSLLNWRLLIKLFIIILLIATIVAGITYIWISDQTEDEEIKASRGIADVAMALTYAKIKNIQPQNQNWADPEFIKNNLTAVLAIHYPSLASFDPNGQFNNCPYILRIYTSSDLSQFLVIAQPAPSLLSQWFSIKSSIVVDSDAMEMRKVDDLRALNRLLVNTLDGSNAAEISNVVKQGELISLDHLNTKNENLGFTPPKALSLLRPGAQNLIYNAPRYYPLGEDLMQKSLDLVENRNSHHDPSLVQQEIQALSKFSNLVLYSSEGLQYALQAQKALLALSPKDKFLIAYLKLNSAGLIVKSRLLMDDFSQEIAMNDRIITPSTNVSNPVMESKPVREKLEKETTLSLQLNSLAAMRQQALEPLHEEMISVLQRQHHSDQPDFVTNFQYLLEAYHQMNRDLIDRIAKKLFKIYQDRADISLEQFLNHVRAAGLETAIQENLQDLQKNGSLRFLTPEEVEAQLQKIEESHSWESLSENVKETAEQLNLERLPEPDKLISHQNAIRAKVIQKLNQFILAKDTPLTIKDYEKENRQYLTEILKSAWIDDLETHKFYLNEFDSRAVPPTNSDL